MIAEQILRCGLSVRVSLEQLVKHYLKKDIDKEEDLRKSFGITPVNGFSERQLEYAAGDCIYPFYIAKHQKPKIKERELDKTLALEFAVLPIIAKMEHAGMRLDVSKWTALYQEAVTKRDEAERKLDQLFRAQNYYQKDLFNEGELQREINYRSHQQLKKVFLKLGYELPSTESDVIAGMAIRGQLPLEMAKALVAYRIYNTRVTRYGMNVVECVEPSTGHIHTTFTQCFTNTGRLSSTDPNVQNLPRNKEYRGCIIPDDGYVFIIWDLKAIEPRILGDMSLDPTYVHAFSNNLDIYSVIGEQIYHEEVSKSPGRPSELRTKAKIAVLGTSYGTGKPKFHERLLLDLNRNEEGFLNDEIQLVDREESDLLWEGIFRACPEIRGSLDQSSSLADPMRSDRLVYDERAAYTSAKKVKEGIIKNLSDEDGNPRMNITPQQLEQIAEKRARERGYVTYSSSLNGRKRFFVAHHGSWWTEGRNHPIQSTASDVIKTAMVDIAKEIEKRGHDATILNQAHDELVIQCKREQAEEVNEYVRELMEAAGNKFLRVIPCVAEGGIKEKWEKD
jgi:DNA polymerase I-like protein with 3'-5' exonuclease and polymerase domains